MTAAGTGAETLAGVDPVSALAAMTALTAVTARLR